MAAELDKDEFALVKEAVEACAAEQSDQVNGRRFMNALAKTIKEAIDGGVPMYTILTGLWVTIHTLAEDWRKEIYGRVIKE